MELWYNKAGCHRVPSRCVTVYSGGLHRFEWFVKEQLEEVSSMDQLPPVLQRAGEGNLLRARSIWPVKKGVERRQSRKKKPRRAKLSAIFYSLSAGNLSEQLPPQTR
jgi:hypothetical protein